LQAGELIKYSYTVRRLLVTLSDEEHEALRRVSYERRVPIAELIRTAVDRMYNTNHTEIGPRGRPPAGGRRA
jgi:hypothetical protein